MTNAAPPVAGPPEQTAGRRRSRAEWCRLTLRILAACFALAGAQFVFFPDATIDTLNAVGGWFGFTPAPASALRFWVSLATGYMVLVTALAYLAQRDLARRRELIALLALGKATTALVALGFYVWSADAFVYLVNFIVDGAITVIVVAVWFLAPSSDSAAAPA